ncbi:MAG: CAP domain-containing protein [Nitrospirae bacterium]|nr:CAP domain-containing protein [Nitrospirota bacterium]
MQVRTLLIVVIGIVFAGVVAWQYKFSGTVNEPVAIPAKETADRETHAASHLPQLQPTAQAHPQPVAKTTSSAVISLKTQQLLHINKSRASHGLPPVSLDDTASKAAQRHCEAMLEGDFFGHTALNGSRPFHRYNLDEGGDGHVAENVCLFKSTTAIATDDKSIAELALKGHDLFMAEVPPDDGHRRTILEKHHNYVGIGVYVKGGSYTSR